MVEGQGQGFEAGKDVFVIGDRFGRHARKRSGGALRNAAHLAERQKVVERDDIAKRKGIVAVLNAVFARLQQIEIKVVVKLLGGRQCCTVNFFENSKTIVEMLATRFDGGGRIVRPLTIEPAFANVGGEFGIFRKPTLPVSVKINAEVFCGCDL